MAWKEEEIFIQISKIKSERKINDETGIAVSIPVNPPRNTGKKHYNSYRTSLQISKRKHMSSKSSKVKVFLKD